MKLLKNGIVQVVELKYCAEKEGGDTIQKGTPWLIQSNAQKLQELRRKRKNREIYEMCY